MHIQKFIQNEQAYIKQKQHKVYNRLLMQHNWLQTVLKRH